jgi:DNA-directed RNA polymerase subunit RPC12/RpoP
LIGVLDLRFSDAIIKDDATQVVTAVAWCRCNVRWGPVALTIQTTCRTCGRPVYLDGDQARGLGKPYIRCSRCKSIIIIGHRNEWELKSSTSRAVFVFSRGWTALWIPILLIFLVGVSFGIAKWMTGEWHVMAMSISALLFALGMIVPLRRTTDAIKEEIRQSRKRLLNPDYQAKLKHMGLLTDLHIAENAKHANTSRYARSS